MFIAGFTTTTEIFAIFEKPEEHSLNVQAFEQRRDQLRLVAYVLQESAARFKYCSHKNADGSDARYPTGAGEMACNCGEKWD